MSFSDLVIGGIIAVVGYKLGESVQRIRQERDDSEYGLGDFISEALDDFQNGEGFCKLSKSLKEDV